MVLEWCGMGKCQVTETSRGVVADAGRDAGDVSYYRMDTLPQQIVMAIVFE